MRIRTATRQVGGLLCALALLGVPPAALAQTNTTFTAPTLDDLPSSGTLGGLFETTLLDVVSDRIEGGGLSVGSSARLGSRGSAWSQTAFYFGDLDLTEAGATGRSFLSLDSILFSSADASNATLPTERTAPGLSIRVVPIHPTAAWERRIEVFGATPARTPGERQPPPIASLRSWRRVAGLASGPLIRDRLGMAAAFVTTGGTRFERAETTAVRASATSALANFVLTPSSGTEVSVAILARVARAPFEGRLWFGQTGARARRFDALTTLQVIKHLARIDVLAAGAYARSNVGRGVTRVPTIYLDSVRDRPVIDALGGEGVHHSWSVVLRINGTGRASATWLKHARAGVELGRLAAANEPAAQTGTVAELVEGIPARLWQLAAAGVASPRHITTAVIYGAERMPIGDRLTIDAGARWETVQAGATGGEGFTWSDLFPRVSVRYAVDARQRVTASGAVARYGYRPTLESLAYGDPAAPSADVFRWDDRNRNAREDPDERAALVARAGSGAGLSSIDPNLSRPYLDELVLGFEVRPSGRWMGGVAAMTRAEHRLFAAVNTLATPDAYTVGGVLDPGPDVLGRERYLVPLYSRRPESSGADRYVLTNPAGFHTTGRAIELYFRYAGERLWMIAGAAADEWRGPAMSPGFQPLQNDRGIPGLLYADPNAQTFSSGSYFSDRSYTIKTAGIYRFPHDVRLGVVARYQDGQAFSRLILATNLSQGAEAVRAYENGRTRFTFTETVDVRLQKTFAVHRSRVTALLDVFNLLNTSNEVEENVVTGPEFRLPTALQPPRAAHAGVRIAF